MRSPPRSEGRLPRREGGVPRRGSAGRRDLNKVGTLIKCSTLLPSQAPGREAARERASRAPPGYLAARRHRGGSRASRRPCLWGDSQIIPVLNTFSPYYFVFLYTAAKAGIAPVRAKDIVPQEKSKDHDRYGSPMAAYTCVTTLVFSQKKTAQNIFYGHQ